MDGDSQSEPHTLRQAIEHCINRHSAENGSNTPDFLLAEFLMDCIATFDKTVNAREGWYGRTPAERK